MDMCEEKFINNILEHQPVKIIPMIDGEVVGGDGDVKWLGCIGDSRVGQYVLGKENIFFKGKEDPYFVVKDCTDLDVSSMDISEIEYRYELLPWEIAIIVDINPMRQ